MDTAEVMQVIKTTLTRRGDGKATPIRIITQYWSLDGKLLVEVDPCSSNKFNSAELMALKQAMDLLTEGYEDDTYYCTEGEVDLKALFEKCK